MEPFRAAARALFFGEPEDGPRCTVIYEDHPGGGLNVVVDPLGYPHEHFKEHPFGGAGLTMTLMDYARFAQMLLDVASSMERGSWGQRQ